MSCTSFLSDVGETSHSTKMWKEDYNVINKLLEEVPTKSWLDFDLTWLGGSDYGLV
jgi:hypothetical protein